MRQTSCTLTSTLLFVLAALPSGLDAQKLPPPPVQVPQAQNPQTQTPSGKGVPTAAELDKARPDVVRTIAKRLLRQRGDDARFLSSEILAAAFDTQDRPMRYLLWQQAIDIEVQQGNPWVALNHTQSLAQDFGTNPAESGVALLKRMAATSKDQLLAANIGLAAMHAAGNHVLDEDPKAMLSYYDVAVRTALRSGHAPIYTHVRDRLPLLRAPREIGRALAVTLHDSPWDPAAVASGLLHGSTYMLEPFELRDLASLFDDELFAAGSDFERSREAKTLTADELIALSKRARHPLMKTGLLRCAQQRLIAHYVGKSEKARRESCRKITKLAAQLCMLDGVSRLRFEHTGKLDQLAIKNGKWRVEDGLLVGTSNGANNFATHRVSFSTASVVVIRGGIRTDKGLNFRCQAGDLNLLLNWEVEPQNHLWQNGTCHRTTPPALTAGEEHTITIFNDGSRAHVCIDDRHMWSVNSHLAGTVSVYPALGSEIFVREILIDGNAFKLVSEAIGVLM